MISRRKAEMLDKGDEVVSVSRGLQGGSHISAKRPLLVEVISEGPHCVPCEYAIAAVEYVQEDYQDRIEVRIVETKRREDARRYLDLCGSYGGLLPVPSILIEGRVIFEGIPGPEELCSALDEALLIWENKS
jgi:hypothetical protein